MPVAVDRAEIEALIPQRAPFAYVDRVVEHDGQRLRAAWHAGDDEPWARGHFPGNPIMPGVLQIECIAQAAAVLLAKQQPRASGGAGIDASADVGAQGVPMLTRVNSARFRRPIRPGDAVAIDVEITDSVANAVVVVGKTSVDGGLCCRAELTLARVDADKVTRG